MSLIEGTLTGISKYDVWCGWMPVYVEAFRTKRRGQPVTRFRLRTLTWGSSASFPTEARAVAHAEMSARQCLDWCKTSEVPGG